MLLLACLAFCCCSSHAAAEWAPWADLDDAGKVSPEHDGDAVSFVQRKVALLTEAHEASHSNSSTAKVRGSENLSNESKPRHQKKSLIMALALKVSRMAHKACSVNDYLIWLVPIPVCFIYMLTCRWEPWMLHWGTPQEKMPALIQQDISGRVSVETTRRGWRGDLVIFHLLRVPWPIFWLAGALSYLGIILCFAFLFFLGKDTILVEHPPVCFNDAFLLSVQTFSTVGYGTLAPKSNWGHAVMILEVYASVVYIAVFGGIIFGRVGKPTMTMLFSNQALVKQGTNTEDEGHSSLYIRILNERPESSWIDVSASVSAVVKAHGHHRVIPLKLVEERSHVLHATWTLVHRMDDLSPLKGFDSTNSHTTNVVAIIALISGTDQVFGSTLHATHTYYTTEILFNRDFVDVLEYASDRLIVHTEKVHDTVEAVQ